MEPAELRRELSAERKAVENNLRCLLNGEKGIPARLKAAMRHSLMGGGKRLRPVLALWTWDALTGSGKKSAVDRGSVMDAACALEMLHTYSLIHDDLPAMDDDDLRRGRPTCHVAFDEATAILAGDGLQALAFCVLARSGGKFAGPLVDLVGRSVGPAGMVGGQQNDLDAEGAPVTAASVRRIHRDKTARLLAASLSCGALLAGSGPTVLGRVEKAGLDLGLAFQGADDILDVTATTAQLGKSAGKDVAAGKATWVRVEGLAAARKRMLRLGRSGLRNLEEALPAGAAGDRLCALAGLMWNRDR
ncbi:MAG: polyprenyl synthetase family protein [Candidatus Krumholzibacteriota bacterium]